MSIISNPMMGPTSQQVEIFYKGRCAGRINLSISAQGGMGMGMGGGMVMNFLLSLSTNRSIRAVSDPKAMDSQVLVDSKVMDSKALDNQVMDRTKDGDRCLQMFKYNKFIE
jgi:hypothetical protein